LNAKYVVEDTARNHSWKNTCLVTLTNAHKLAGIFVFILVHKHSGKTKTYATTTCILVFIYSETVDSVNKFKKSAFKTIKTKYLKSSVGFNLGIVILFKL